MPKWAFSRRPEPPEKPVPSAPASKAPAGKTPPTAAPTSAAPARRVADGPSDSRSLQVQLEESRAVQSRLRQDLAELLKAHRQQGRVLERNQRVLEQAELDLSRHRERTAELESDVAEQRNVADQHAARVEDLEQVVAKHATLQTAYEALDRERHDLPSRLAELTRSRANATSERDRLAGQLATAHATIAARDAQVAALTGEQEGGGAEINRRANADE